MFIQNEIASKVKSILDTKFDYDDISTVPDIADSRLTFGNKGLKFEATVIHVDLRSSTELLNKHNKPTLAKIHKAYFHVIVTIADILGGEIRSFNGDSMLVFFPGTTKTTLSQAVKAAMKMKYLLGVDDSGVSNQFKKYSEIDFGIGIDDGKILCAKIGKGRDSNNQDLIWLGNAVNKAVKIGDNQKSPYQVGISSYVYSNLLDDVKYHEEKDYLGKIKKINMWSKNVFNYNNRLENYYYTSYYWTID